MRPDIRAYAGIGYRWLPSDVRWIFVVHCCRVRGIASLGYCVALVQRDCRVAIPLALLGSRKGTRLHMADGLGPRPVGDIFRVVGMILE